MIGKQINNSKITKKSKEYAAIGALAYIIISLLLGLIVTFGKNPYSKTLLGILTNIWIFGSVVVAKEYIRYKLINNVYEKDKIKMAVLITVGFRQNMVWELVQQARGVLVLMFYLLQLLHS